MGSLEKLSEAIELAQEKVHTVQSAMSLVMLECKNAEVHYRTIQEFVGGCFSELESKEEHLKSVHESMCRTCEEFDSKRRWVEEGLKKLDEKEKFLKGVLQEIEAEKMEFVKMSALVEEKLKDVSLKERRILGLLDELSSIQSRVEKRGDELDLKAKMLEGRGVEIDSKEKNLEIREREVDSKERILERREKVIALEEQKLEKMSNGVEIKQKKYEDLVKEFQLRQGILQLQLELVSLSKTPQPCVQEPDSLTPSKTEGRKRCWSSGLVFSGISDAGVEGISIEGTSSNHGKRSCISDISSTQIKPQKLGKSGSDYKPQVADVVVLDDSEHDSISMGNLGSNAVPDPTLFSKSIEKDKTLTQFSVGETWACVDANDKMPRSYAQIIKVVDEGVKVRYGVDWLKPFPNPLVPAEKQWVDAGLPVACGMFKRARTSIESPSIFSHRIYCSGNDVDSSIIIPSVGETWAIYKDFNILTWAAHPEIHRLCKYEIVLILSYPQIGSPNFGVRVAYLSRITGFVNVFGRKSMDEKDTLLIRPNSLYMFSHKVPSVSKTYNAGFGIPSDVFELDLKSLPLGI